MPGDVTFNSGDSYFGGNLTQFVNDGKIPVSRVDDMAIRIVAAWYLLKQDSPDYPKVNFDGFKPDSWETNEHIDVQVMCLYHCHWLMLMGMKISFRSKMVRRSITPLLSGRWAQPVSFC
jgi:hypothetical protein